MTKENNNWLNAVAKPQANMIANQIKESKNDREHRYYTQKLNNWQMLVAETLQITPDEAADILTGTEEDSPFRREVRAWTQRREAAQADIKAGADLEGVASRYLEAPGVIGETFVARLIATTTDALAKAETDNDRDAAAADFLANLQGWHNSHPILQSDIQEENSSSDKETKTMTKNDYIKTLAENLDGDQTVEEVGEAIAEMYHATPEQVWAVTEIEAAMWDYMDTRDIDQLAEDLMHETSERFLPCSSCGDVYPAERLIDAGTGKWTDDLCPSCAGRIRDHAYARSEAKAHILRGSLDSGRLSYATVEYLDLDPNIWLATTIDSDGYRSEYITDKVLAELVDQLADNLQAAETEEDRDILLDKHLDVLDVWQDRPTLKISLAAARVNAGLTQDEAADLIGVTRLNVQNWEAGKYRPTPERYPAIEAAYGIPIEHILI